MKSNTVSQIWAGWFNEIPSAIAALNTLLSLTTTPTSAPVRVPIIVDDGTPSQPWGLGFFVSTRNSINALFVAASLTNILSPPPLATPMQWNERALRLPWIGWFTDVYNAITLLNTTESVTATFDAPPLGAILLNQE